MCSVQWRRPRWPLSTFQGQIRRQYVPLWKTISVKLMFAATAPTTVSQFPPPWTTPHREKLSPMKWKTPTPVRFWPWRGFVLSECSLVSNVKLSKYTGNGSWNMRLNSRPNLAKLQIIEPKSREGLVMPSGKCRWSAKAEVCCVWHAC